MHFTIYTTHLTVYKPALNYNENMKNRSKGESLKYASFRICMRQLFNTIGAFENYTFNRRPAKYQYIAILYCRQTGPINIH